MPTVDWSLDRLTEYLPPLTRASDFDQFWARTRAQLAEVPVAGELERIHYPCKHAEVFLLRLQSVGGQSITCWYLRPAPARALGAGLPHPLLL